MKTYPRIEKIKTHFRENKKYYLIGLGAFATGAAGTALYMNRQDVTNALIGGWTLAGITRWSSGLPFNIHPRLGFGTSFEEQSNSVITAPIKIRKHIDANGFPQVFDDPQAIINGMPSGSPVRFPYRPPRKLC